MYCLLFNSQPTLLSSISYIDLGSLLTTIAILVYIYRFARSRVTKDDMKTELNKKASKNMVLGELKLRDERITGIERMSEKQEQYIKERFEEQHSILDSIHQDVDVIQNDIKSLLKKM